ncbi:MAG: PDZ domain-containing protein [Fimbriiglobus sp.]
MKATVTALSLLFAFAAYAPAQDVPAAKPITVPFTLLASRHMLIEVKINDKGPYKLIFDTGAPLNLINSRVGKETGLVKKSKGFALFSMGVNQVEIATMLLGDAKAEKLPAVIMDHPTVKAISDMHEDDHGKIEGIVGFPFFARFATTVDYQKKQLILTPNGYKPGDYIEDLTKTMTAASEKSGKPKILAPLGFWGFTVKKGKADTDAGVVVAQVLPESPMAEAGLKANDRILTIDGRWTDSPTDAYVAASLVKEGRTVEVKIDRDGKEMTLSVTPSAGF